MVAGAGKGNFQLPDTACNSVSLLFFIYLFFVLFFVLFCFVLFCFFFWFVLFLFVFESNPSHFPPFKIILYYNTIVVLLYFHITVLCYVIANLSVHCHAILPCSCVGVGEGCSLHYAHQFKNKNNCIRSNFSFVLYIFIFVSIFNFFCF